MKMTIIIIATTTKTTAAAAAMMTTKVVGNCRILGFYTVWCALFVTALRKKVLSIFRDAGISSGGCEPPQLSKPKDRGSTFLRNVGTNKARYTVDKPKRRPSFDRHLSWEARSCKDNNNYNTVYSQTVNLVTLTVSATYFMLFFYPKNAGTRSLRNVCTFLSDTTMLRPRRPYVSLAQSYPLFFPKA
jgi:hypothetical protein